MKRLKQTLLKLFITFLFCSNSFSDTEQISSKNVLVIDGDTIILDKKKIRFSGIDAPESFFRGKKQICKLESRKIFCGEISKKKLIQKMGQSDFIKEEGKLKSYQYYFSSCFLDIFFLKRKNSYYVNHIQTRSTKLYGKIKPEKCLEEISNKINRHL